MTTSNDSPAATPIQPLHNPSLAAQVVVPQAPLGNVANQAPGMGAKALLAKKLAKSHNHAYVSPTDNLVTPVPQKLNAAKKKHFTKSTKPVQLFSPAGENHESSDAEEDTDKAALLEETPSTDTKMEVDDENPF
ncbi:hypothetical protein M413DRAFT_64377 [Hebeloma cylindrosporum]|uniref:Uncharacterized protein n=1 Tax=Hebeloma cylindrosporum TaxID=76867 RepID=A0A0C3CQT4_HEBCY|nr:hypothetical protein M413DRAFT_64377 [Hebeloma cylindrosporum h7]